MRWMRGEVQMPLARPPGHAHLGERPPFTPEADTMVSVAEIQPRQAWRFSGS